MQGVILRRRLTPSQWHDFTETVAETFEKKFGGSVEYERDVHFGVGTKE